METQRDWEHGAPEETGSGGLRAQTDACGCSGAGREGGASTRRWTLVQQKKKNFQVICTTQYWVGCQTVQSSHTQGGWGYRTPIVAPGVLFMAFYSGNRRNPPAEQLQTEKLKEGQSCISQASHPGGEHYLWHTGNAYALTSVQEALTQ